MVTSTEYSSGERFWLSCLAVLGFVGVNGAFLYGVIRPEVLAGALSNPVSLAFVVEALLLLIVLAYLLTKWGVLRMHWSCSCCYRSLVVWRLHSRSLSSGTTRGRGSSLQSD